MASKRRSPNIDNEAGSSKNKIKANGNIKTEETPSSQPKKRAKKQKEVTEKFNVNEMNSKTVNPPKPLKPFKLFYEYKLKRVKREETFDEASFKEKCKEQWRNMDQKKKIFWINVKIVSNKKQLNKNHNLYDGEPELPPTIWILLFIKLYQEWFPDRNDAQEVWENMTEDQRSIQREALWDLNKVYIRSYQNFLKGLTLEELKEYSKWKKNVKLTNQDSVSSDERAVRLIPRTSRVDQLESSESRIHPITPSSLPYRPVSSAQGAKDSKIIPPCSSVNRKPQQTKTPKVVRTLLPSDNGFLSFNEGEKLKVILEVDSKWLLCCRGDQKGLVPRSAVIAIDRRN